MFILFDMFVKCFRFIEGNKVGVNLFETEFLGWTKNMIFFKKREP